MTGQRISRIIDKSGRLLLCLSFLLLLATQVIAQDKLPTGFYKRVPFSSYKYIDSTYSDTLYLDPVPICNISDIQEVEHPIDGEVDYEYIQVYFKENGIEKFARATKENIGKKIAVIVNGRLLMAPVVQSEIEGGKVRIVGNYAETYIDTIVENIRAHIPGYRYRTEAERARIALIQEQCSRLDTCLTKKDTLTLKNLLHDQLIMGHSNGFLENKRELIEHLVNGYLNYEQVTEQGYAEVELVKNIATVRRLVKVKGSLDIYPFEVKLNVMEVWIDEDGVFKLLCRQSVKRN